MLIAYVIFALALAVPVYIGRCVGLIFAYQIRRRIPIRPKMIETPADRTPDYIRRVLAASVGPLAPLGYQVCANGYAPAFGDGTSWWQIVFQNSVTMDRISVICDLNGRNLNILVIAATEFADGKRILTMLGEASDKPSLNPEELTDVLPTLISTHLRKLEAAGTGEKIGLVAGQEIAWLEARAAVIAEARAKRLGWIARDGFYRPRLTKALAGVWRHFPIIRWFTRPAADIRGFEVQPGAVRAADATAVSR